MRVPASSCSIGVAIAVAMTFGAFACGSDSALRTTTIVVDASAPDAATGAVSCGAGATCQVGHCSITVPLDAAGVTIAEEVVASDLAPDTLTSYACVLGSPGTLPTPVRLSVDGMALPLSAILVFEGTDGATAVPSSIATSTLVQGLVSVPGTYLVSARSAGATVSETFSNDPLSSADTPSLIRNLALQSMAAAWFDGARYYVGDGPRVLIYSGGAPTPQTKPSVILGQPDLDTVVSGTSASVFGGGVNAIWSNGSKLVVAETNRVLVWNAVPTTSFTPADLVLGQQDFVSLQSNTGGLSASTVWSPRGLDSDGTRLVIADTLNHRVLAWSVFPTSVGQAATSVLGQSAFSTGDPGLLYQPWAVLLSDSGAFVATAYTGASHFPSLETNTVPDFYAVDPSYPLRIQANVLQGATSVTELPGYALAMTTNQVPRICIVKTVPTRPSACDFVLGQPNPDRAVYSTISNPVTASSLSGAAKVLSKNGVTLVADTSRVLVYEHTPAYNSDPADRVIGQAGFSVNDRAADYRRNSEHTLAYPSDLATNGSIIAVADRGNNRVVLYNAATLASTNAPGAVILGQKDATSFIPNVDQVSPSASTMSGPSGVAITSDHLAVADTENHRVLIWTPIPTQSGTPATLVLGQSDFAGRRPNRGNGDTDGDGDSDATAVGMFSPTGVAILGTRLFVADRLNHRVLVWNNLASLSSGVSADGVLGQSDFTHSAANSGNGLYPLAGSFSSPTGLFVINDALWIADTENNRVVRWDSAATNPFPAAVIGQSSMTDLVNPNAYPDDSGNAGMPLAQPTSATSVLRPRSVTARNGRIFVSEQDSNRIRGFDLVAGAYNPAWTLGQPSPTSFVTNAGGLSAGSLSVPQGLAASGSLLFVADSSNHRVLVLDGDEATQATKVVGQVSFFANGFDQALASSAGGATSPRSMAISNGELFVAERGRSRVLVHQLPLVPGRAPTRIIGQPDLSVALPNGGGTPSATTLANPTGVTVDDKSIVIADTANNRVLIYPRDGSAAATVLGQTDFAAVSPNRGGAASAISLKVPEGVFKDGDRLIVADTGNNRLLVWNSLPSQNGQPADIVIGQDQFDATSPNGGTGDASATSLAGPTAVLRQGARVYVADTGNNRVLEFDSALVTGAAAVGVVGQPDFSTRTPAGDILTPSKLAGPVALASDGTVLYVADRDENRVLGFALAGTQLGAAALSNLNANKGLVATGPSGLAVERTALFTSRLYVADTNKDQIIVVDGVSRLR